MNKLLGFLSAKIGLSLSSTRSRAFIDGWFMGAGFVACDLCNYEWVAVRPANCEKLECPNCKNITTFTTPEDNE